MSVTISTDDVGELATPGRASTLLREIRTFPYVLFVAIQAAFAVAKDGKVATDAVASTDIDMRERTVFAGTAAFVREMEAQRRAFRCWVMREIAGVGSFAAVAL